MRINTNKIYKIRFYIKLNSKFRSYHHMLFLDLKGVVNSVGYGEWISYSMQIGTLCCCALFCYDYIKYTNWFIWIINSYWLGLHQQTCGNRQITHVPVKSSWVIWVKSTGIKTQQSMNRVNIEMCCCILDTRHDLRRITRRLKCHNVSVVT